MRLSLGKKCVDTIGQCTGKNATLGFGILANKGQRPALTAWEQFA